MRPLWSGFISFGLINIAVRLYSAVEEHGPKFELFHALDFSPIRYARVCKKDGKEIPWNEIVKGFEYQPGEYVMLTGEDFEAAHIEHEKIIDVMSFVEEEEINSIFYEKPYYLEPGKGANKSYALLRQAIDTSKKVGISKFILHNKEHYAVLKTYKETLILNQIRVTDDLRKLSELNIPQSKTSRQEIDMALLLIDKLSGRFEPQKYHDTYSEHLYKIIEQKAKGKKIKKVKRKEIESTKVVDLMSELKKSLGSSGTKKGKTKTRKTA